MMGVTHGLVGLLIGLTSQWFWEPLFLTAAIAALIGGLFPDLDLLFKHRKTLHFPVGYTFAVPIAFVLAYFFPSQTTVAAFYFILSASLHCIMDVFGGGLEPKPWNATSQEAVYSHTLQKWFKPKRWIRYDGSPEDLILATLIAIPTYLLYEGLIKNLIVLSLVLGVIYTVLRKKIVDWAPERFL